MTIPISEVFGPTIQGEGPVAGHPTVFVRTGGCDYRCSWCDSLHAVLPAHRKEWKPLTATEVFELIRFWSPKPILVTLSGGNPAMHSEVGELIDLGHRHGYTFGVETQGTIAAKWLADCDWVVLSPKPPSSGMKYNHERLVKCIHAAAAAPVVVLKVPVFNSDDFYFAEQLGKMLPNLPLYLSVGNENPPADPAATTDEFNMPWARDSGGLTIATQRGRLLARYDWICQMVLQRQVNAIVLPQLHVLAWGNKRRV